MQKTYKREVSLFIFGLWLVLFLIGIWHPDVAAQADKIQEMAWSVLGGAFALDAISKQIMGRA